MNSIQSVTKKIVAVNVIIIAFCVVAIPEIQAQEKSGAWVILDCIKERANAEWVTLSNQRLTPDLKSGEPNGLDMRTVTVHTNDPMVGTYEGDVLNVRAQVTKDKGEYGVRGQYVVDLPKGRYIQFRGSAKVVEGDSKDVVTAVELEIESKGQWERAAVFEGGKNSIEKANTSNRAFLLNLSEWAGKKARLSLVTRVVPAYQNIGGKEVITPETITAEWYTSKLVSSDYWFEIGKPEKVSSFRIQGKTIRPARSKVASATIANPTVFEQILRMQDHYADLGNPIDIPISSTIIPANIDYATRYVGYFSAILTTEHHGVDSPEWEYGASTRMFDFIDNPSKNLYSASVAEVTAAILIEDDSAVAVLSPSGDASRDFDDHHVDISSIVYDTLSDSDKVIHAFFHAEDHFQFEDDGSGDEHGKTYASIGYARSTVSDNDFGRTFDKMYSTSGLPIIKYKIDEENIIGMQSHNIWGCGQPSVIPIGYYYYLYFTTWSIVNGSNPMRRIPIISVARALKNEVNLANYSSQSNPWFKFKEVNSLWYSASNWTEAGIGGDCSGLYNAELSGVFRTDQADSPHDWRYAPMVSYNNYLNKYMIICDGGLGDEYTHGVIVHTSTDPVSFDDGLMIILSRDILRSASPDHYKYAKYVSLIGSGGEDRSTTEYNKMYFRWYDKDYPINNGTWRAIIQFIDN